MEIPGRLLFAMPAPVSNEARKELKNTLDSLPGRCRGAGRQRVFYKIIKSVCGLFLGWCRL